MGRSTLKASRVGCFVLIRDFFQQHAPKFLGQGCHIGTTADELELVGNPRHNPQRRQIGINNLADAGTLNLHHHFIAIVQLPPIHLSK